MTLKARKTSALRYGLLTSALLSLSSIVNAAAPVLAFSDLVSGPDTGLGDNRGSGVVVTVWGQHLGSLQGSSTVEFCDSARVCRAPAHLYYWKNADGQAPSGPANLFESHGMQEIAFSIPDSAAGAGTIRVTTSEGVSNTLPFIVRTGNIYHVSPSGNDSNPGTFAQPWLTSGRVGNTASGGTTAPAGSTVYFHGLTSGSETASRGIYINNSAATAPDATTNFFLISYPGTHSVASGREGFTNYQLSGTAISKFRLYSSNCTETENGQRIDCTGTGTWGVRTDKWGRVVGNYLTDHPGRCSSMYQGAITGDAKFEDNVSSARIFGNEVEEYGCYSSNALHHTTYLTVRSGPDDLTVTPWEFGWNYLHNNHTKSGIHQFDQDDGCGDLSGPLIIRNNVVVNQAGPGIYVGGQCGWTMDAFIENNIVINAGLPVEWNGIDPNTSTQVEPGGIIIRDSGTPPLGGLLGTMHIRNNTIHGIGWSGMTEQGEGCLSLTGSGDNVSIVFSDNICINTRDYPYIGNTTRASAQLDNITGSQNSFYYAGSGTPSRAIVPTWDLAALTGNPLLTVTLPRIAVNADSPINSRSETTLIRDIYGIPRSVRSSLGAVTYTLLPALPVAPLGINAIVRPQ